MIQMMIAAPASGSGKTAVACGMLALLKQMNKKTCAFKCGPDYIDPMFHRAALGVQSYNLDLFLSSEEYVKAQYDRVCAGCDAAVCEGVMGFYDGVAGITAQASAWHVADVLDLPVILVIDPKGASLTLAAQIKGICSLRTPHHIAGVIFNRCSPMLFQALAGTVERESGIPVLGYLPSMAEAAFESRHLGLYTAGEIDDLSARLDKIAVRLAECVDMERLFRLCGRGSGLEEGREREVLESRSHCGGMVPIAVARDEAFCFVYQEPLDALRQAGADLIDFSLLHDAHLPEGVGGLYLPGGYPELYAKALSENVMMRQAVRNAVLEGLPTVAECGGFLYLGRSLAGSDGIRYPMAGALPGTAEKQDRLVRFGYSFLRAETDSLLFRAGEEIPAHEFHYWDSTENGDGLQAFKPGGSESGEFRTGGLKQGKTELGASKSETIEFGASKLGRERSWRCGWVTDSLYAGFPHLYFAGSPRLAERFVQAAVSYEAGLCGAALYEQSPSGAVSSRATRSGGAGG